VMTVTMKRLAPALALLALLLAACSRGPDVVHWGVEECSHCQMMITDERFAGQVVDRRGKTYKFDALECMADWVNRGVVAAADFHSVWVSDGPEGWTRVEDAAFLHSDEVRSPMGGGYIAFADAGAAERMQAEVGGRLMTWEEVLARVAASGHAHGPNEGHGQGSHAQANDGPGGS
jgi:copper chaperone NosL